MFKVIFNYYKQSKIGFIGIVLAIIFGSFTIYDVLFEPKTNISYKILSESNVIDVHEPLDKLNIIYDGNNILEKNMNLRIIRILVENTGSENISKNHFDEKLNWGIQISNGEIIDKRLIEYSSNYIRDNLKPEILKDNSRILKFEKIIFDKKEYFVIDIFVLHKKSIDIKLNTIGKLMGKQEALFIEKDIKKEVGTQISYTVFRISSILIAIIIGFISFILGLLYKVVNVNMTEISEVRNKIRDIEQKVKK